MAARARKEKGFYAASCLIFSQNITSLPCSRCWTTYCRCVLGQSARKIISFSLYNEDISKITFIVNNVILAYKNCAFFFKKTPRKDHKADGKSSSKPPQITKSLLERLGHFTVTWRG